MPESFDRRTLLKAGAAAAASRGPRWISAGLHEPKHVCIIGASYGGYAALAGVTLQTGIYRCAVSVAGLADLPAFLRWTSDRMSTSKNEFTRHWDRFLGVTGPDDPRLEAISPVDHVAAVTVPVLLIHGRDDTVVPYAQSEEMAKALSATREQMLERVVRFLERYDPPA